MLAGEYAVLFADGSCVAAAVGEIAHARWTPGERAALTLDAFDAVRTWPWAEVPQDGMMRFVCTAVSEALAHASAGPKAALQTLGALHVQVAGQRKGLKLGLGSSAATTVATLRATLRGVGQPLPPGDLARLADRVHKACQDGAGSGYDVHTIAHGGCVHFDGPARVATPLRWPAGLFGAALYTGRPASTVAALRRGIGPATPGVAAIRAAAEELVAAWRSGDVPRVLAAATACEAAFDTLAEHHDWLVPEALAQTRQHIRDHGAVARTSGAGGGDCVLALSDDPTVIDALVETWQHPCVARLPDDLAAVEDP